MRPQFTRLTPLRGGQPPANVRRIPSEQAPQATLPGLEPPRPRAEHQVPDALDLMYTYKGRAAPGRFCFSCCHFSAGIVRAESAAAFPRCAIAIIKATEFHPWKGEYPGCGEHRTPIESSMSDELLAEYRSRGMIICRTHQIDDALEASVKGKSRRPKTELESLFEGELERRRVDPRAIEPTRPERATSQNGQPTPHYTGD